jgi:acetoin utilization protein AcuB
VVGIITESDILRAFIDMMGILSASSRIDVVVGDQPSELKKALQIINDTGGEIINVGQAPQGHQKRTFYFRLAPCKTDIIKTALEEKGFEVAEAMD